MARFVKFPVPAASGNYLSAENLNLMLGDTANLQQTTGGWITSVGSQLYTLTPDATPTFGDFKLRIELQAAVTAPGVVSAPLPGVGDPVTAGDTVAIRVVHSTEAADQEARVTPSWRDAGGGFVSTTPGTFVDVASAPVNLDNVAVVPVGAESVILVVETRTKLGGVTPEGFRYIHAACVRVGVDATFVPSLRIVGDVELEAKVTVTNPVSGVTQWLQTTRSGDDGYGLFIAPDGRWGAYHGDGTAGRAGTADTVLTPGVTYDLNAAMVAGVWTMLLDGLPDGTPGFTDVPASPSGLTLKFGENAAAANQNFEGEGFTGWVLDGTGTAPRVAVFDAEDIGI